MSYLRGIKIVKEIAYGAEAGGGILSKTVFKKMSQDGKQLYGTLTRTVVPDAKHGTRAIWTRTIGNGEIEKTAQYTNRTRTVDLNRWFGTDHFHYELDDAGKYLTRCEDTWIRTHNPVSFEKYSTPRSGSRLDIFEADQSRHYVNGQLFGVHPPVHYTIPSSPINY